MNESGLYFHSRAIRELYFDIFDWVKVNREKNLWKPMGDIHSNKIPFKTDGTEPMGLYFS